MTHMKTERRHELQQDDLSVQIEKVTQTIKRNATLLAGIVVGATVVVAGIYWYRSNQQARLNHAWAALSPMDPAATPTELIGTYEDVARQGVSTAITRSAWLKTGAAALEAAIGTARTAGQEPPDRKALLETAENAYKKVLDMVESDSMALGQALMGLGIIAESRGRIDEARTWYQRATEEPALKDTPLSREAAYRLAGLANWGTLIEFPPPPPPATTAPTTETFTPPTRITPTLIPAPGTPSGTDAGPSGGDAAGTSSMAPQATTQPAGE